MSRMRWARWVLPLATVGCGVPPQPAPVPEPADPAASVENPREAPPPEDPCRPTSDPTPLDKDYAGVLAGARCQEEVGAIMRRVSKGLGVKCKYCHVSGDFVAMTDRKLVANWMATEMVPLVRTRDGGEPTCASCHEGQARILKFPRDRQWATEWMTSVLVERFDAHDGKPLRCKTCHGATLGSSKFRRKVILTDLTPAP